jgi:hypothetical protein
MAFFERAAKIVEKEYEYGNNNTSVIDTSLEPFIQKPFREIIDEIVTSQPGGLGKTVLYPGCGTDIIGCMLRTGAETLIGLDMVDPSFYPGLEESKVVSESTKNVTEMVHIITDMTTSLKIITDTTREKFFDVLDISNNKLVASFTLFGIPRKVIVYVGVDADKVRLTDIGPVDVVVINGYTPSSSFFAYYKPKFVMTSEDEFSGGKLVGTFRCFVLGALFNVYENMYHILDLTDANDPLILAKATLLKEYFNVSTGEIRQLGVSGGRKTRRKNRSK